MAYLTSLCSTIIIDYMTLIASQQMGVMVAHEHIFRINTLIVIKEIHKLLHK